MSIVGRSCLYGASLIILSSFSSSASSGSGISFDITEMIEKMNERAKDGCGTSLTTPRLAESETIRLRVPIDCTLDSGDADYILFNTKNLGHHLGTKRFIVYTTGTVDTQGTIYKKTGSTYTEVAKDDNSAGLNGPNFMAHIMEDEPTEYVVEIKSVGANQAGNYKLHATITEADLGGNTIDEALHLETFGNNIAYPYFLTKSDQDYFSFSVKLPLDVTMKTFGPTDTVARLFDVTGKLLKGNDDANNLPKNNESSVMKDRNGTDFNSELTYPLNPGFYYLRLSGFAGSRTGPYTMSLSTNNVVPSSSETDFGGDSIATALDLGKIKEHDGTESRGFSCLCGWIASPTDSDYFKIEVTKPGALVAFSGGRTDTYGELLDSTGTILPSQDGSPPAYDNDSRSRLHFGSPIDKNFMISRFVQPGTYYLKVRGYNAAALGSYGVTFQLHGDDDVASYDINEKDKAVPISPWLRRDKGDGEGSISNLKWIYSASPSTQREYDYYIFKVREAMKVNIKSISNTDMVGSLLDFQGNVIAESNDAKQTPNDKDFQISATLQPDVYYFVKVRTNDFQQEGLYRILITVADEI